MPWDCLPEHINEPHEWNGYDDDDHFYTRWRKKVKGWFAVGNAANRSKYSWCNWRKYPVVVWAIGSDDPWRLETDNSRWEYYSSTPRYDIGYLSRVQYIKKWHIALQWPLFLHGHYGNWQCYIGLKRDADKVYWLALYLGKKWK